MNGKTKANRATAAGRRALLSVFLVAIAVSCAACETLGAATRFGIMKWRVSGQAEVAAPQSEADQNVCIEIDKRYKTITDCSVP